VWLCIPHYAASAKKARPTCRAQQAPEVTHAHALRFYQRRGFCLVRVHRGAVDRSRASLKPEIPPVGAYGIPLRDEIELERSP